MKSGVRLLFLASFLLINDWVWAQEPVAPPTQIQEAGATPTNAAGTSDSSPGGQGGQMVREVPHIFSGLFDSFEYEPRGRRDPFSQTIIGKPLEQLGDTYGPLLPLQRFNLEELRLTGIIWNVSKPKAILKDPSGNIHVVTTNSKIGSRNGYVAAIREGEIVVVETIEQDGRLISTAQVVKIAK